MKSCLITGASRGIGRSTALKLSNKFDRMYLHGRDEKALNETLNLIDDNNKEIISLIYDFSETANVNNLADSIDIDQLDVLVNNAGMSTAKPFEDLTLDEWNMLFNINPPSACQ